jgi:hypothetical protein
LSGPRGELESRGTFTFHYGSQPCQDPIALLEEQAAERVPEVVPIGYGRMSASPFAVFRGAAYVMASHLAGTPQTEIRVQLCGDDFAGETPSARRFDRIAERLRAGRR